MILKGPTVQIRMNFPSRLWKGLEAAAKEASALLGGHFRGIIPCAAQPSRDRGSIEKALDLCPQQLVIVLRAAIVKGRVNFGASSFNSGTTSNKGIVDSVRCAAGMGTSGMLPTVQ